MNYPEELRKLIRRFQEMFPLTVGLRVVCNKFTYETLEDAERAAEAHNRWPGRDHDVEAYHCLFCGKYHKGGKLSDVPK